MPTCKPALGGVSYHALAIEEEDEQKSTRPGLAKRATTQLCDCAASFLRVIFDVRIGQSQSRHYQRSLAKPRKKHKSGECTEIEMSWLDPRAGHAPELPEPTEAVITEETVETIAPVVPPPPPEVRISWEVDPIATHCSSPADSFLSSLDQTHLQHEQQADTLAWLQVIINFVPVPTLRGIWAMSGQRIRQTDFETGRSIWVNNGHRAVLRNELYPKIYAEVAVDKRQWDALVGELEMEETIAALQAILRVVPMEVLNKLYAIDRVRIVDEETGKWTEKRRTGHRAVMEEALGPEMCELPDETGVECDRAERADSGCWYPCLDTINEEDE